MFVDLYNKGYIYRGQRMINWDVEAKTTVSNEEVLYKEDGEKSMLYSIRYKVKDTADDWITIATQRPETIMGDVAIAVNPTDARYQHLIGKKILVPFINREIPVIADAYVDKEFVDSDLENIELPKLNASDRKKVYNYLDLNYPNLFRVRKENDDLFKKIVISKPFIDENTEIQI